MKSNDYPYKLSIIIPVFNVEPFIKDLLVSLQVSDKKPVEFLFVDDCGDDNSVRYVAECIRKNKYAAKLLTHGSNQGLSAARNTGLENASGEYIWFVDSDDKIVPNYIDALLWNIDQHACDVFVHDFTFLFQDANDARGDAPKLKNQPPRTLNSGVLNSGEFLASLFDDKILYAWSLVYRRSLFAETRFPVGCYFEDIMTIPIVLLAAKSVHYGEEQALFYRQRSQSIMAKRFLQRDLDMLRSMSIHYDLFSENKARMSFEERDAWLAFSIQTFVWGTRDLGQETYLKAEINRNQVYEVASKLRDTFPKKAFKPALARMKKLGRSFDAALGYWLIYFPKPTVFLINAYHTSSAVQKILNIYIKWRS